MKFPFCPYEEKTAQLLNENRWGTDPALTAHAQKCSRCSNVVMTVQMLQQNRTNTSMATRAVSPGYLWWKAQLLRQNGALEQITKPVVWAERLALCGMLFIAAAVAFCYWGWFGEQISGFSGLFGSAMTPLKEIWLRSTSGNSLIYVSLVAGLMIIAGVGGLTLLLSDSKK
jgi:hypothetical protein